MTAAGAAVEAEVRAGEEARVEIEGEVIVGAWTEEEPKVAIGENREAEVEIDEEVEAEIGEGVGIEEGGEAGAETGVEVKIETEEEKAEYILATKDMVGTITKWLEDVAAMKAEQLLEIMDSIRENQGSDVAAQYEQSVKPALEAIYAALESNRQGLSKGLAIVSGGEVPTMGSAPEGGMGGGNPLDQAAAGLEGELGAEAPPVPGEGGEMGTPPAPEAERMKRESVDYSRRLGMLLSSKKK
jgi:hypothetical protein